MKILNITPPSLKTMSDKDIAQLHKQIHAVFKIVKQYRTLQIEFDKMLEYKHFIIVRELNSRDLDHNTPLR